MHHVHWIDRHAPFASYKYPLATRAYTLTGLTNYTPHTFTLSAMDNGSAVLTQTIQATPTDHLVYLPLIRK